MKLDNNAIVFKVTVLFSIIVFSCALEFKYHDNDELESVLKTFAAKTKNIRTHLYSIGDTKKRNKLWVIELTAADPKRLGVPNVKLIGNMHGNEAVGREILLHLIEYLRDNYEKDVKVSWLLNNTNIHIMPTLNPDGFAESKKLCTGVRERTNGIERIDLNRDFPDYFHNNMATMARETKAVIKWMSNTTFILSAALHGGALLANYPFDSLKETKLEKFIRRIKSAEDNEEQINKIREEYIASTGENPPSPTPDDDVFKHLSTVYSETHPEMHLGQLGRGCPKGSSFEGGITNGAKWYSFEGSMGDYNYYAKGCMEVTLEISCCKYPNAKLLPDFWNQNKMALINYSMQANRGVTGQILDSKTGEPISGANLTVLGRNMIFHSSKRTGEFWRILLPGNYSLQVKADGYYSTITPFTVKDYGDKFPELTFLKILLLNNSYITTTTETTSTVITNLQTIPSNNVIGPNVQSRFADDDDDDLMFPKTEAVTISVAGTTVRSFIFIYIIFLNILF